MGRVASSRFNSESSCGGELSSWCTRHGREPDTGHEFSSWPSEQPYISNEFPSGSYVTGATFWPILRGVSSATSSSFAGTTSNKARGQEPGVQTEVREQNSWWGLVVDLGQALGIRAAALWHLRSRPRVEDWELQVEFEHLPEQLLVGEGYLEPTIGAGDEEPRSLSCRDDGEQPTEGRESFPVREQAHPASPRPLCMALLLSRSSHRPATRSGRHLGSCGHYARQDGHPLPPHHGLRRGPSALRVYIHLSRGRCGGRE